MKICDKCRKVLSKKADRKLSFTENIYCGSTSLCAYIDYEFCKDCYESVKEHVAKWMVMK